MTERRLNALGAGCLIVGGAFVLRGCWGESPKPTQAASPKLQSIVLALSGRVTPAPNERLLLADFPQIPYRLEIRVPANAASVRSETPVEVPTVPEHAVVSLVSPGHPNLGPGKTVPCQRLGQRIEVFLSADR